MIQRILHIWLALVAMVGSVSAQTLSVQPIEVQTGEQTEVVVSLTGATAMTALQFNLQLPTGVTATKDGITLGAATDGHAISVKPLYSGDLLFVLYNLEQKTFNDGELLRIPVTVNENAQTGSGQLYTVRTATTDAVSNKCAESSFNITVNNEANGIMKIERGESAQKVYDLHGRSVTRPTKGIYIIRSAKGRLQGKNGQKVVK